MIADDEPDILEIIQFNLQSEGYEVVTAKNGEEAFEKAKKFSPDLIMLDIMMPGKNGIEGVWEIKERWPEIKVIMLTVFEDEEKIFGAIKAGANGYLLKKDSPQKILDAIEAVYNGESPMNGLIATKVIEYFHAQKNK